MNQPATRRTYLDVLRGVAVLVMIEAHVIDSWTRAGDRGGAAFGWSIILGGFGAPLFLFLAGVAIPLSAASKARRLGDERAAAVAVQKRGLEIFLLALLFRVQALVLSASPPSSLLKVDILNIMGPAIVVTAMLWALGRSTRSRIAIFAGATLVIAFTTPIVRAFGWLASLPDPIEGYIRPIPGLTNFSMFPWGAFVPAGAVAGMLIEASRSGTRERRVNAAFAISGMAIAVGAYAASLLPSPYPQSNFWTSSPAFFFLRVGVMTAAIGAAFLGEQLGRDLAVMRALRLLGQTSLFIYWIHVEMVYGLISTPLHAAFSLAQAWAALGLFSGFMLVCAALKVRVVCWSQRGGWAVVLRRNSPPSMHNPA